MPWAIARRWVAAKSCREVESILSGDVGVMLKEGRENEVGETKLKITRRAGSLAPDREPNQPITSSVKTTFGLRGIYKLFHSLVLGHRRSIEL